MAEVLDSASMLRDGLVEKRPYEHATFYTVSGTKQYVQSDVPVYVSSDGQSFDPTSGITPCYSEQNSFVAVWWRETRVDGLSSWSAGMAP